MREQISRLQFFYLSIWLVLATGIVTMPAAIGLFTVRDGWMVPIPFGAYVCVLALIYRMFLSVFPNKTLFEAYELAFGRVFGAMAEVWTIVWLIVALTAIARELMLFVLATQFPSWPPYSAVVIMLLPVVYATYLGLEVLGRSSEFLTPPAILISIVLIGLSVMHSNGSALTPVLADGWKPVWQGTLPSVLFATEIMVMLQLASRVREAHRIPRDLLLLAASFAIFGLFVMLAVITVLGQVMTYMAFPILEVVRTIRFGQFIERLDTLYVMGVIATIFLKMTTLLLVTADGMKDLLRLKTHKSLAIPLGGLVCAGGVFGYHSSVDLMQFIVRTEPAFTFLTYIALPLTAILIGALREKMMPIARRTGA